MSNEVNAGFGSSNVSSLLASLHALNVRSIIAISNVMVLRAKPLDAFIGTLPAKKLILVIVLFLGCVLPASAQGTRAEFSPANSGFSVSTILSLLL